MTKKLTNKKKSKPPKIKGFDGKKITLDEADDLMGVVGSSDNDLIATLLSQVPNTLPPHLINESGVNEVIAMLHGIGPQDELEGMLSVQMVAVHSMAMEMANRCMLKDQTFEGVNANVNHVTKLMRTFTAQVEALQRYRGKGKQVIQVQHVHVSDGGQAVVGNVNKGG